MARRRSGMAGLVGRAGSLAATLLAVLTLVASGASHELLHADERGGAITQASATTAAPDKAAAHHKLPVHGCSGHCAAHAADQAPIPTLLAAPLERRAAWRLEAGAALRQRPTAGPERPPRA